MPADIVTIASEVLAGHTVEGNFATLVRVLAREGIAVVRHTVVPDDRGAIAEALREALARVPLVVTTGGLGATPDDLTRGVVAALLDRKLTLREPLLAQVRAKYLSRGIQPPPAAEVLALLPSGARALENRLGLAPGFHLEAGGRHLFALPGVPEEMEAMLLDAVVPALREARLAAPWLERTLRLVGVPETTLAALVDPLLPPGVQAAYLPHAGRLDLRLGASAGPAGEAALRSIEERLEERLGAALYACGETTLEAAVLARLRERGLTLAVAESLTGGLLGGAITRVAGASEVFRGGVVAYANEAKQKLLGVPASALAVHGAVSAETARAMASGARRALNASVAVSTTGIAGPGGGTPRKPVGLVYCGLAAPRSTFSYRFQLGGSRAMIQDGSVTLALHVLWLFLLERLGDLAAHADAGGVGEGRG